MILDQSLLFSDAQAVTAAAASTNVINTGPLGGFPTANTGRNLGVGEALWIFISVDVVFADSGSNSTLTVALETDDAAAFGSAATVATLITLPALAAAGSKYFVRMPPALTIPYEQYLRIYYTPNNGDLTTGNVSCGIVKDIDQWSSYFSGFSTGI